jgi:hypothetical protein
MVLGLSRKHYTKLEMCAMDNLTSLLLTFVIYSRNKFYNIGSSALLGRDKCHGNKLECLALAGLFTLSQR